MIRFRTLNQAQVDDLATSARDEHPLYRMMAIKNDSLLI